MRIFFLILIILGSLGCNKPNSETNSSSGNSEVTQISDEQKPSKYKNGDAIELYDLLYSLLPEENSSEFIQWSKGDEQKVINWLSDLNCSNSFCEREGKVIINMNNDNFEWGIYLKGDKNGFYQIGLGYDILGEFQKRPELDITNLDSLFFNKTFESTIIENTGYGDGKYIIKFSNKKAFYLKMSFEAGKRYEYFSIDCYTDEKYMHIDDDNY